MADGSTITARGRTELQELTAAVSLSTAGSSVAQATVRSLHIDTITATDLTYRQGDIVVQINRPLDHPVARDPRRRRPGRALGSDRWRDRGDGHGRLGRGGARGALRRRHERHRGCCGPRPSACASRPARPPTAPRAQSVDADIEAAAGIDRRRAPSCTGSTPARSRSAATASRSAPVARRGCGSARSGRFGSATCTSPTRSSRSPRRHRPGDRPQRAGRGDHARSQPARHDAAARPRHDRRVPTSRGCRAPGSPSGSASARPRAPSR